jgi:predicted nucleotidyltransferase
VEDDQALHHLRSGVHLDDRAPGQSSVGFMGASNDAQLVRLNLEAPLAETPCPALRPVALTGRRGYDSRVRKDSAHASGRLLARPGSTVDVSAIEGLLARIEQEFRPYQVWLFGSRARGDARERSDWDLLVVVPDDTSTASLQPLFAWRLQRRSGIYADIIVLTRREFEEDVGTVNSLANLVAKEGLLLRER